MGKNQHSKDRLYITATEWKEQYGGVKKGSVTGYKSLPFDCECPTRGSSQDPPCTNCIAAACLHICWNCGWLLQPAERRQQLQPQPPQHRSCSQQQLVQLTPALRRRQPPARSFSATPSHLETSAAQAAASHSRPSRRPCARATATSSTSSRSSRTSQAQRLLLQRRPQPPRCTSSSCLRRHSMHQRAELLARDDL